MSINTTLTLQMLMMLVLWMTSFAAIAYYIDKRIPPTAKKSAMIAAVLSIIPLFGIAYLIYLYLTAKRRLK
jgi:small-conductance mechanosensitive channel